MSAHAEYPEAIDLLIQAFARLPGIGRRTAERLVFSLLDWPDTDLAEFGRRITHLKEDIKVCRTCGNWADAEHCMICRDPEREKKIICVVESTAQIMVIERSRCFHGLYHVLGGRIAPLDGIGPEDLRIDQLSRRLKDNQVRELILATGADVEGEATASYVKDAVRRPELRITRIAFGVPVGGDIGYADAATIAMAINSRHSAE